MIKRMALLLMVTLYCGPGPAAPSHADGAVEPPSRAAASPWWPRWRPFWL